MAVYEKEKAVDGEDAAICDKAMAPFDTGMARDREKEEEEEDDMSAIDMDRTTEVVDACEACGRTAVASFLICLIRYSVFQSSKAVCVINKSSALRRKKTE